MMEKADTSMDAKNHYENYWEKNQNNDFFEYERNLVLPKLFDRHEKVLDLGCGDGIVSEYLQKKLKNNVTGADISPEAIKRTKKRGVKCIVIDVEKNLPFDNEKFDSVFWGDNIEHLFDPQKTLLEIKRVLKKKGRLILSCPNLGYWRYRVHFFLKGSLPDTEWTGNPPWGWSHIRFFNTKILKDFLNSNGFVVRRTIGINKITPDKYLAFKYPDIFANILVLESIKK